MHPIDNANKRFLRHYPAFRLRTVAQNMAVMTTRNTVEGSGTGVNSLLRIPI